MLEEMIAVLDGGPGYEGLRLIRQDGRPQIADIREDAIQEAERLRQLQHLIATNTRLLGQYVEAVNRDRSLLLSMFGRIGRLTTAIRARRRWADLLHRAIVSGATLSYRQRRAIARLVGMAPEELTTWRGMSEALDRLLGTITAYENLIARLRREAEEIRARYRSELAEMRSIREALQRYIDEARRLQTIVEQAKTVIEDHVDHITIEMTYATETCEGHEPLAAEIRAYTTVMGEDNIRKDVLLDIESRMDACLSRELRDILSTYFGAAATHLIAKLVKIGVRYLYHPEPEPPYWPTVAIDVEYGWPSTPACIDFARAKEIGEPPKLEDISSRSPRTISVEVVCA